MNKRFSLINSFKCAFKGISFVMRHERNMRIHMVVVMYVAFFSAFYDFTKIETALLIITCALVMIFEILNTSIEVIVDKVSPKYSPLAKVAKDAAAGAVLLSAIMAVAVGAVLFFDIERFKLILLFLGEWTNLLMFIGFSAIAAVFVTSGKRRNIKGKINND